MPKGWISSVNIATLFLVLLYMLVMSERSSGAFGKTVTLRRNSAMQKSATAVKKFVLGLNCAQIFSSV